MCMYAQMLLPSIPCHFHCKLFSTRPNPSYHPFGININSTRVNVRRNLLPVKRREQCLVSGGVSDLEPTMVLVVRQNLKMGQGKIASQCALCSSCFLTLRAGGIHFFGSDFFLLQNWEQCGRPKIVCTCKNQQEMIKLMEAAENIDLPTFVVSDAGRTQVAAEGLCLLLNPYKVIYVFNMLDYVLEIKISIRAKRARGFSNRAVAAPLTSSATRLGSLHYATVILVRLYKNIQQH